MVIIDSDVLLIDLRYPRDARHLVNAQFLRDVRESALAIAIYTLNDAIA